jgi:hypothetical protein
VRREVDCPPLPGGSHRGPTVDDILRRPESHVWNVSAALLRMTPSDRRAFIGPLIALIDRIAADGGYRPTDRPLIPVSSRPARRRIGRIHR